MIRSFVLLLPALLLLTSPALGSSITFTDGLFAQSDWELTILTTGGGGSASAIAVGSGGNPGPYREVTNTVITTGPYARMYGFHGRQGADFDPGSMGAISSIDYSEDSILLSGFGQGQGTGPALLQDGRLYFASTATAGNYLITPERVWTPKALSDLQSEHFRAYPTQDHPDFSATGSPITFGFYRMNSGGSYTIVAGIDNWSLTVNYVAIPETSTFLLLGLGLCVAAVNVRRKRRSYD